MSVLPIRFDGLEAKVETVYATDPIPSTTNGVRLSQRVSSSLRVADEYPNLRDDEGNGSLIVAAPTALPAGRHVELDLRWPIRGYGAAYSASNLPEADPLFQACGCGQAIVTTGGSESVTYTPAESGHVSCTVYAYASDGNLYKVVGCRGTFILPINAGERGIAHFMLRGILSADPAAASLPAIGYNTQLAPPAVSLGLSVGAWTPTVVGAEFRLGADVVLTRDGNSPYGLAFDIAKFVPEFNLRAKAVALATFNPFADSTARTARAIAMSYGSAQYKKLVLAITSAYLPQPPTLEDQDQFTGWNLTYRLATAADAAVKFN